MREVAAELSIPLADVAAAFTRKNSHRLFNNPDEDWIHPNNQGQKVMARVVFQAFREAEYLKRLGISSDAPLNR